MNLLTFPPPHHFKTIMNCAWKRIKGTSAENFLTPLPCSILLVQYNDRNVCITKSHQMWLTFTVIVTLMIGIFWSTAETLMHVMLRESFQKWWNDRNSAFKLSLGQNLSQDEKQSPVATQVKDPQISYSGIRHQKLKETHTVNDHKPYSKVVLSLCIS